MSDKITHNDESYYDTEQRVLASMAHELKTPLSLISGLSSEMQLSSFKSESYQKYVQRIQFSSDRLLSLVDTILRGYELQQEMLELRLEPICPQLVMEEVAHELSHHAKRQGQLIEVISKSKKLVVADRGCLHAVLFNLLDNAIKYSKPETTIELVARARSNFMQLMVKDYGHGIKKSDLKKLFEQFGRVERPVPSWASTTGLGLYIARQLTEAMNGNLQLTRRSSGTNFLVNLQPSNQLSLLELL